MRLLIDQDLNQIILRGLRRRLPQLDAVTAYEVGLSDAKDPELLAWAADNGRITVTHDRQTMPAHSAARIAAGERMAGVIIVPRNIPIRNAIDNLELIVECSRESEWEDTILILPL
jgi:predicted nuclease of predicted toxin-antitoxin system